MDMGAMDSSGMAMNTSGLFGATNMAIARAFWYLIAAIVGVLYLLRLVNQILIVHAIRSIKRDPEALPSKPRNVVAKGFATATAICREMSYPQPWLLTGYWGKYFNPPSLGRCCVLVLYWIVILIMLWDNVILNSKSSLYAYKWEIVGFRAAWVSVTQLPLIYALSCKMNFISIITGISYERLNWLHRWSARTMFMTLIVHWTFFFREWVLADFVSLEMSMMPMVKYGFGAWAVIGWMVITGFGYFRSAIYEVWVMQHIVSAGILLWLVYVHVPVYARYNVWMAVGFVVFDWSGRALLGLIRNIHCWPREESLSSQLWLGYEANIEAVTHDVTKVIIKNIKFTWKPGQHIFITMPTLGILEAHPFSIANETDFNNKSRSLELYVKAQSGFSARLFKKAKASGGSFGRPIRVLVNGPWGSPCAVERFETLIFICTSIGATFTIPIFQAASRDALCVRRLVFHWIIRDPAQITSFSSQILSAVRNAHRRHLAIIVKVWVTRQSEFLFVKAFADLKRQKTESSSSSSSSTTSAGLLAHECDSCKLTDSYQEFFSHTSIELSLNKRPSFDSMIKPAVEAALGETGIFVCGGIAMTAEARSFVAFLSDERAVHKGTGAQGISLFTERFGW